MINRAEIISAAIELAPTAGIVLLAAWVMWLFWRVIRRGLQALVRHSNRSQDVLSSHRNYERREPTLEPAASPTSSDLNTSEILALKASIDALSRQVENLTRTLSSTHESGLNIKERPSPNVASQENVTISIDPRAFTSTARAAQSRALTEKIS